MSNNLALNDILTILGETLQLGARIDAFDESTEVLGGIPEFDSMAVVTVITAVEEKYGFTIDDDEISAETFETVGSLYRFVKEKLK